MVNCVPSLFMALGLVTMFIFIFSMMFAQFVVGFLHDTPLEQRDANLLNGLETYYGRFDLTMLSLWMAVSGGADWRDVQQPLANIDSAVGLLFLVYIFVMMLGMFNVLVGIFCDRAFEANRLDRDFMMHQENEEMRAFMSDVMQMFLEADADKSGMINMEQFMTCMNDVRMISYLNMHKIHMIDSELLFKILDRDDSGEIELHELISGMMMLTGQARSCDVMSLITLTMEVQAQLSCFIMDARPKLGIKQPSDFAM